MRFNQTDETFRIQNRRLELRDVETLSDELGRLLACDCDKPTKIAEGFCLNCFGDFFESRPAWVYDLPLAGCDLDLTN